MNKTELLAKEWLINKGYKEAEIIFVPNSSPDFICRDGERYEVKYLYGKRLLFTESQIKNLLPKDKILVFNRSGFVDEFLWRNKDSVIYEIHSHNPNKGRSTLVVSQEFRNWLETLGQFGDTHEAILRRVIGNKFKIPTGDRPKKVYSKDDVDNKKTKKGRRER